MPAGDRPTTHTVAAVDLGSNSFHMLVARPAGDAIHVVDKLRERVALAAGLDEDGRLDEDAQERALSCLSHFGQRLRDLSPENVRAVGTNTLRRARGAGAFLGRAVDALGHPIEIVSGREEARLVYAGVAHDLGDGGGRRLVVDIGGGSTELILGRGLEAHQVDSLYMGHLEYSLRYFRGGRLTKKRMQRARLAARVELETIERTYRDGGWHQCVGSSGTALAVAAILDAAGWSTGGITADGLREMRRSLYAAGHCDEIDLPGLKEERRPVIAGGVAILSALFSALRIERMAVSEWALREGLLYDQLGRLHHDDVRERTIQRVSERYHVDRDQAARVEETALALLDRAADPWELELADGKRLVSWGARLHEIGLALSYAGHHKHGAYLVANSDLPGFSRDGQRALAALILCHRRRIRTGEFDELAPDLGRLGLRLALLLRLAVLLHRDRSPRSLPPVEVRCKADELRLRFPDGWLGERPRTRADLEHEALGWGEIGFRLRFRER